MVTGCILHYVYDINDFFRGFAETFLQHNILSIKMVGRLVDIYIEF